MRPFPKRTTPNPTAAGRWSAALRPTPISHPNPLPAGTNAAPRPVLPSEPATIAAHRVGGWLHEGSGERKDEAKQPPPIHHKTASATGSPASSHAPSAPTAATSSSAASPASPVSHSAPSSAWAAPPACAACHASYSAGSEPTGSTALTRCCSASARMAAAPAAEGERARRRRRLHQGRRAGWQARRLAGTRRESQRKQTTSNSASSEGCRRGRRAHACWAPGT